METLRQEDSSVDDFFRALASLWRQLDELASPLCQECHKVQKADRDRLRLYDFVCRLRPEFEPVRAQLLSRSPRPTVTEALSTLRAEELRRGLAAQFVPAVLATPSCSTTSTIPASTTVHPQVSVSAPVLHPLGFSAIIARTSGTTISVVRGEKSRTRRVGLDDPRGGREALPRREDRPARQDLLNEVTLFSSSVRLYFSSSLTAQQVLPV